MAGKIISKLKNKKNRKIFIIAGAVVFAIAAYFIIDLAAGGPVSSVFKPEEKTYNTAVASYGGISKVIEGSGTVTPNDEYQVTSMLRGDIIEDYIEEGMIVKEGDVLYEIDPDDINDSITNAQDNLTKAQMSLDDAREAFDDLTVKADFAGVITELLVKNGDEIGANQTIAVVKDTENLTLKIPFNQNDASKIKVGDNAEIIFATSTSTATGKVKSVSTGAVVNSEGVPVSNVEISVKNPGAVVEGDIATASVGEYACNSYGTFSYGNTKTYVSAASGTVTGLSYVAGDKIAKGANIAIIESSQVSQQLTNAQMSYNQAARQLENLQESLDDDYNIKAKVTGEIVQKNSKKGDTLDATNGAVIMAIIQDTTSLTFSMSIDELDITDIKVGQTVAVTADAIEGVMYQGTVTTKSTVGTSLNGVTTYPVEVTLLGEDIENAEIAVFGEEDYERRLIPGMNVTGDIVVDSRENVLTVPVSAIQRGNMVVVKKAGGSEKKTDSFSEKHKIPEAKMPEGMKIPEGATRPEGVEAPDGAEDRDGMTERLAKTLDVPEGFEVVRVETGLADDNNIEILSGLSEGDIVVVPEIETGNNMFGMFGAMMGGGMRGGMSGGMGGSPSSGGNRAGGMAGSSNRAGGMSMR